MFSEWIRNKSYWTVDRLKGSPVHKHYIDIEEKIKSNITLDTYSLNKILEYASNNVPFYWQYKYRNSLEYFPVVNKCIIKENYDQFQSQEYKNSKVIQLHTSGSTGTPFTIRQDVDKRNRCLAEMMYFWGLIGYKIGMRYIYYRTWNDKNRKGKLSAFARNIIMSDILRFDDNSLHEAEKVLKSDKSIKMLLGYASTLDVLGNHLYEKGCTPDMFNIKSIVAISESLPDSGREKLINVFGCPVVSHYSNSENGVLAQWDDSVDGFIINTASFVVELLDLEADVPVEIGKPGRIVITDLYNKAMPMLRYDTGDIGVQKIDKNGRLVLSSIEGRKIDFIFDTKGRMVSPHEISVAFWAFPGLRQYQFIQNEEKQYVLKVIPSEELRGTQEIVKEFKRILGDEAVICVEVVNEIPVLSSGKRRYIINKYK